MKWESPYHPQPHQARFHSSPATFKLFLGGVGAGKTITGVHETAFAAEDNSDCDGLIVAPTYPMLRDVIIPVWRDWIHPSLYDYKKADQLIIWHTGRNIYLRSATEPDRASGLNIGFGWLDEGSLIFKDRMWRIMQARRRQKARRSRLIVTTTPNGMNWVARWFRDNNGFVVRCRTKDNKHLPEDFEPGLRASYGDEYAAQFLDAEILELQGRAWPVIKRMHCGLTLEQMLARCVCFFGAVDWGHTNPAALLIGGLDVDGRWFLVDEWYKRGQNREDIASVAAKMSTKWNVRMWFSDHDPEGVSRFQDEGLPIMLAEKKDVVAGVQYVRSLLSVRNDGQPRLYVGSWLKNWHRENEGYQFPEEEEEPIGQNGDHLMDCTRYLTYTHSLKYTEMSYQRVAGRRTESESRDYSGY